MQSLLTIVGAVVAVVAGVVGLIAAIDQLTIRTRLRRTAELARTLASYETNEVRAAALGSIHDVAVARLVAGWLLPWWRFSGFAVWVAIGPGTIAYSVGELGWGSVSVAAVATCLVFTAIAGRRFIRLYLERQRMAREYVARQPVEPPRSDLIHQMEDGTRIEFVMGLLISAGLTVTGAGVGTLLHYGVTAPWWAGAWTFGGTVALWLPVIWLRARTVRPLATEPIRGKIRRAAP